ncbi:MAG: hypothetical protein ACRELB_25545, partial [Polyangiaceae bacterium]
ADLLRFSQLETHALYEGNHLDTAAADGAPSSERSLDVASTGAVSRAIIERKVRQIAQSVGLDDNLQVIVGK